MEKPRYIRRKTWQRELRHVEIRESLDPNKRDVLAYLYQRLSILDTKVAVLLTVNSILLAAISVAGSRIDKLPSAKYLFLIATPVWLFSTVICLSISFLKWEHMHNATSSLDHYRGKLIKVTIRRSFLYNIAVALILILVCGVATWAWIEALVHPSHVGGGAETSLTLVLEDKRLVPKASNPAYVLEHIGRVGPFAIGDHQVVSQGQTDGYMTIKDLCQNLTNRSSHNVELKYIILAGKVDKREPDHAVRQKYGSNLNLAQQRASWVKHALVSNPGLSLTSDKVITVISGAEVLREDSNSGDTFASDRVVECYAVFESALSK